MLPRRKPELLGANASALLDAVRFAAACTVALLHLEDHFVRGHITPIWSANAAVCVFFVLSGFVVRHVTRSRERTATVYWIDRASRIYSVVAPALVVTIVAEAAASIIQPALYQHLKDPYLWSEVPLQLLTNITFTAGLWGYGAMPLSNGPFWSLTFEVVFYILYGLLFFRVRRRWLFALPLLVIAGPSIALLFPIWLLGVALYEAYERLCANPHGLLYASAAAIAFFATVFALRHPIVHFLTITGVEARGRALTALVHRSATLRTWFPESRISWLDRLSVSYYLTGPAAAFALLPLLIASDRLLPALRPRAHKIIRLIADSTFVLYLVHAPLAILFTSINGRLFAGWRSGTLLFAALIAFSIVFAIYCERLKKAMRTALRRRFITLRQHPASQLETS